MVDETLGGEIRGVAHKASNRLRFWGLVVVLAGIWCVLSPIITATSVAILVGIGIAISGASALASASRDQGQQRVLDILLGLLGVIAALLIIFNPSAGAVGLGLVVTILLAVRGLLGLVFGFQAPAGKSWILLSAVVDLVLAFLLYRMGPAGAAVTVGIYVGLSIIVWGVRMILAGRAVRSLT
jgi:membrane protein HdeD